MHIGIRRAYAAFLAASLLVSTADGAVYRIWSSETEVLAGAIVPVRAEVETEPGDNVVAVGYFSFAVDLALSGTAGSLGDDISGIVINESAFDDLASVSLGLPAGSQFLGIAGATTDVIAPTFGHNVGDLTWLFDFDLTVPLTAELGDTITITPSEGDLENLIANMTFDNVDPQRFEPTTLVVVPEPVSAVLYVVVATLICRRRRSTKEGDV